jgi:serine/threonine protein kinase
MALTVNYLHTSLKVLHRDLSISNWLVSGERIILCDFSKAGKL